jgi:hypothetical protein
VALRSFNPEGPKIFKTKGGLVFKGVTDKVSLLLTLAARFDRQAQVEDPEASRKFLEALAEICCIEDEEKALEKFQELIKENYPEVQSTGGKVTLVVPAPYLYQLREIDPSLPDLSGSSRAPRRNASVAMWKLSFLGESAFEERLRAWHIR